MKKHATDGSKSPGEFVMIRREAIADMNRLSDPARRVLLALATFADTATGTCFPSREAIAERAGISLVHKVSYATAELERAGYLTITQTGKRQCNAYQVHKVMYRKTAPHPSKGDVPLQGTPSKGDVPLQGTPLKGDVPLQGTGGVPLRGTSLSNKNHLTREDATPMKPASSAPKKPATSAPKKPASAVSREPDGGVRELMRYFGDLHLEHRGSAYVAAFGADGAALKRVLGKLSEDDVRCRMSRYFTRRDRWNETNGYSVRNFCSVINGLQGQPVRGLSAFKLSEIEAARKQGVA